MTNADKPDRNTAEYEIYEAPDGWRWRLRATNGEIVGFGEAYTTKADAIRGTNDHREAAKYAGIHIIDTGEPLR